MNVQIDGIDALKRWRKTAAANGVSKESQKHLASCFEAGIERLKA